ncbi:MAG: PAS domain-containing protein [Anaerolineales bacterium]
MRVAIIALGTYVYAVMDKAGTFPVLAYLLLAAAWLYGLGVVLLHPSQRFPQPASVYFTVITDAVLTMVWLYATGGFASPFFVALYPAVVSVPLRFDFRETALAAVGYAASYLGLLAFLGQLAAHQTEALIRVAYLLFVAGIAGLLVRETHRQARAKNRVHGRLMRELRLREARYRALFEGVPVPLYRTTPEGRILDANEALAHMLGYGSKEELVALNAAALHADAAVREAWKAAVEGRGVARDFVLELRRRDGSTIWVRDSARAVRDEGGTVLAYEGMLEDITERRRADEALRKSEARLRGLVEGIPALVWTTDAALQLTSFVGAGLAALGLRPNHFVGTSLYEVFTTRDPQFRPIAAHREALGGTAVAFEMKWGGRTYQAHVEPVRGADGAITGLTAVAIDISERVRAEEQRWAADGARRPLGGSLTG